MTQLRYTKAAFAALWVLTVTLAALIGNVMSTSSWVMVAALALIPPAVTWRLWNVPAQTMSESIRKAMKD